MALSTRRAFWDAESACQELGSQLASIHSSDDFNDAASVCSNALSTYGVLSPGCWIGLYENSGTWTWTDNSALDYTRWNPSEPSGDGDCVHLWNDYSYNFNDKECTAEMYPICDKVPTNGPTTGNVSL